MRLLNWGFSPREAETKQIDIFHLKDSDRSKMDQLTPAKESALKEVRFCDGSP